MSDTLDRSLALAEFVAGLTYEQVPAGAVDRLKQCLLDFVGLAAFAAARAESSEPFRRAILTLAPRPGPGTVVGEARGYPWEYAALLNGAFAHTLDFDDTNLFGALHPGAPVIPAALAAAEQTAASGRALLESLAAGYEVACRVGGALGQTAYDRGFHITPVAGIFGAVAAGAKLFGLGAAEIASAFGIALSQAAGSMQYLENGAWTKRLHPGFAAHDALVSLALARAGVVGAARAIDGRYGLLAGYSNAPRPDLLLERLGERWVLAETAIKPYPSCRLTHGAIDAVLSLREKAGADARARRSTSGCRPRPSRSWARRSRTRCARGTWSRGSSASTSRPPSPGSTGASTGRAMTGWETGASRRSPRGCVSPPTRPSRSRGRTSRCRSTAARCTPASSSRSASPSGRCRGP